jgi:hypothetical protein
VTASADPNRSHPEPTHQSRDSLDSDDIRTNPATEPTLSELVARRFSRRDLLRGALGAGLLAPLSSAALAGLALEDGPPTDTPTDAASSGKRNPTRFGFGRSPTASMRPIMSHPATAPRC